MKRVYHPSLCPMAKSSRSSIDSYVDSMNSQPSSKWREKMGGWRQQVSIFRTHGEEEIKRRARGAYTRKASFAPPPPPSSERERKKEGADVTFLLPFLYGGKRWRHNRSISPPFSEGAVLLDFPYLRQPTSYQNIVGHKGTNCSVCRKCESRCCRFLFAISKSSTLENESLPFGTVLDDTGMRKI